MPVSESSAPAYVSGMGFLEPMDEEELEELEQGGGLKGATLAGRQRVFDHFADYWDKAGCLLPLPKGPRRLQQVQPTRP